MKLFRNKKGSFIIFITLLFLSMTIFLGAVIKVSANMAISSSVDSLGNLFGNSVLSEYSIDLKNRYGIIAIELNDYSLEEKIEYYSKYSFFDKKYIKYNGIKSDFSDYELKNCNLFSNSIKSIVYNGITPKIDKEKTSNDEDFVREIRAKWIINSLPSNTNEIEMDSNIVDNASIYVYLFRFFKDYVNERELGETFFNYEIEYVITGNLNDNKARKEVYNELITIRNVNNLTYLYSCTEKREIVAAFAAIIAPELAVETEALILEIWALLESKNDLKLLYENKKVPLIKDDDSFATSFENIIQNIFSNKEKNYDTLKDYDYDFEEKNGAIEPKSQNGLTYQEYLEILLSTIPIEKITLRIMDLIQINMKYLYDGSFLVSDYVTGFKYEMKINGKKYDFEISF